jgi:hypothetical protein
VGRALLARAEERAAELGLGELPLYTNVAMVENLSFYLRLGYVEVDRRVECLQVPHMYMNLNRPAPGSVSVSPRNSIAPDRIEQTPPRCRSASTGRRRAPALRCLPVGCSNDRAWCPYSPGLCENLTNRSNATTASPIAPHPVHHLPRRRRRSAVDRL